MKICQIDVSSDNGGVKDCGSKALYVYDNPKSETHVYIYVCQHHKDLLVEDANWDDSMFDRIEQ